MSSIALYTRGGIRLLTLKEAEQQGYGSVVALKKRLRLGKLNGYKVGPLWVIPTPALKRALSRRSR